MARPASRGKERCHGPWPSHSQPQISRKPAMRQRPILWLTDGKGGWAARKGPKGGGGCAIGFPRPPRESHTPRGPPIAPGTRRGPPGEFGRAFGTKPEVFGLPTDRGTPNPQTARGQPPPSPGESFHPPLPTHAVGRGKRRNPPENFPKTFRVPGRGVPRLGEKHRGVACRYSGLGESDPPGASHSWR